MELITMRVGDLIPYENNPRNNDDAVPQVAESIRQCGYVAPIIVDEDNVILAGHTRARAIIELYGEDKDVPVAVYKGLTEEQKRKYRLLDNKTSEYAQWDFEILAKEIEGLDFGFDFGIDGLMQKAERIKEKEQPEQTKPLTKICNCPRCGATFEE